MDQLRKKFVFITPAEYAGLDFGQRDRYLRGALTELGRRLSELATTRERPGRYLPARSPATRTA